MTVYRLVEVRLDKKGEYHSYTDPARLWSDGVEEWFEHGKLHRDDGQPAVVDPWGNYEYWYHGHRHRLSGPAVIRADGTQEYWAYGRKVTPEWFYITQNDIIKR